MTSSTGFFGEATTAKALAELADADALTIVAGAGVGIESALPSWAGLVHRLLVRAGRTVMGTGATEADHNAFADWAVAADGLLGGAEVARAVGQSDSDIARVLYERSGPAPAPGPSARAIGQLVTATGCAVVTTNYDTTIETAITAAAGAGGTVTTVTDGGVLASGTLAVRHLHGALAPDGTVRGALILSESDYLSMGAAPWQARVLDDALRAGPCLFVGMSMSDPNLLRYLHGAAGKAKHKHYALLVRDGEQRPAAAPDPAIEQARDDATLRRWRRVGVEPLRPPWFSTSAQFLYELLARRRGDTVKDYRNRLTEWHDDLSATVLSRAPAAKFVKQQDFLYRELSTAKALVATKLQRFSKVAEERFILTLWAYEPGDKLLAIASSDRAHRDPETLDPVSLEHDDQWTSVQAFRRGTPLSDDITAHVVSRWNTVLGVPVSIEDPRYGRLQVGVMTLAGTEPPPTSALEQLGPEVLADVRKLMETISAQLLRPAGAA